MIKVKVTVIEIENNFQAVFIDDGDSLVLYGVGGGGIETALCEVLEYVYGDCDFDYVCRDKSSSGRYIYDVEVVDEPVWE